MIPVQTLRQISVITGLTMCSISDGFIYGHMSGMINALRHDKTIGVTEDDISIIASIIHVTMFIGIASIGFLTEKYGRKKLIFYLSVFVIIHWIMVYFAEDKTTILISRVISGLPFGGFVILTSLNIREYISPNIRPLAANLMSGVGLSVGIAAGHILCTFLHWKTVALLGIIPTLMSALLPFFWVESPYWLATKKRFDECKQAFRALHVTSEASEKELKLLIEYQIYHTMNYRKHNGYVQPVVSYIRLAKTKRFWRMTALVMVIGTYRVVGGKTLINTLALSMLQDITGSTNILNYALVVDGFMILGSTLCCLLVKRFKMRPLLFTSGLISNCIQMILAACIYYWPDNDDLLAWVKTLLFALYFIIIIAGPYSVLESVILELLPSDGKSIHIFVISGILSAFQFYHIKISIKLFTLIGYHGVFFIDGIITFVCLLYCYFCLPETKNRTLQEIEFYFVNNSFERPTDEDVVEKEHLNRVDTENNVMIKLKKTNV